MELREFWRALSRQWVAALVGFVVCALLVGYAAFAPADQYRASTTVSVEPADISSGTTGDVQVVNFLMPALQAQVGTKGFDQNVRGHLPPDLATAHYTVTSSVATGTGLLTISVASSNRRAVAKVANEYAKTLTSSPAAGLSMRVIAPAQRPTSPQGPHRLVILASGLVLALIVAVVAALIAHAAHRRRSRGDEIRETFGLPVLGEIPVIRRLRTSTFAQLFNRVEDPGVEAFVRLRTSVELALVRHRIATACVTSYSIGAGKSTITGAMAYAMATVGHRVTLIEADLRRPSLASGFTSAQGADGGDRAGVTVPVEARSDATLRVVSAQDVRDVRAMQSEQLVGHHPADTVATALPELLGGSMPGELTLVDSPPITAAETKLIVSLSRWAIIVVDAHRRDALDDLDTTIAQVREAGGEVLGVVLNRARLRRSQRRETEYRAVAAPARRPNPRGDHRKQVLEDDRV